MSTVGPLYHQVGPNRFEATELTAGPWAPNAQHGSPVAALLLHCIQEAADPMPLARITVELLRGVPLAEFDVVARVVRSGKRVQLLAAEMRLGEELMAAATAWTIRGDGFDVPGAELPPPPLPSPDGAGRMVPPFDGPGFHRNAVEIDFVAGKFTIPGPATGWVRLLAPVVDDHPVSPAQRALVAADFGNGFASTVPASQTTFINTDLTLYLSRAPQSERIAIASTNFSGGEGYGFAESIVYDETGALGRSVQALLFQNRK